jgi:hypothetical protein
VERQLTRNRPEGIYLDDDDDDDDDETYREIKRLQKESFVTSQQFKFLWPPFSHFLS